METIVSVAGPSGARGILDQLHHAVEKWRGDGLPMDDETVLVVSRDAGARPGPGAFSVDGSTLALPEALERFEAARKRGTSIQLPATLDSLVGIREWLDRSGAARGLSSGGADMLDLVLYEVCANVVEPASCRASQFPALTNEFAAARKMEMPSDLRFPATAVTPRRSGFANSSSRILPSRRSS